MSDYSKLAARWYECARDWQARENIYFVELELAIERVADTISWCYEGMAAGRKSRHGTVAALSARYAELVRCWEVLVESERQRGGICRTCGSRVYDTGCYCF